MYHDEGELHIDQLPSIDYIYVPNSIRRYPPNPSPIIYANRRKA